MKPNCKFNITNANYRKVLQEVKQQLGTDYDYNVVRTIADKYPGDINSLTTKYVLDNYPKSAVGQEQLSTTNTTLTAQQQKEINQELIEELRAQGNNVYGRAFIKKFYEEKGFNQVQQAQAMRKEMADIKAKAIADGTFMKAPNGKPTNLTERQWLQVRTKAFKKWFGDWEKVAPKNIKGNLINQSGEINWDYFEQILDSYHNSQPDSMFAKGRTTLATREEKHFEGEKNTLNHIKFVTQSMLDLLEGKFDVDLPFVSEARASLQNQKDLMVLAAMFHDAAKPYRHGDIHGWESADILRDIVGIDYNNRLAEWAIRHHMAMPFSHKAEFNLSNPEALEVARNMARDAKRIGIDEQTAINAFVLINAADIINGREITVEDNWAKKAKASGSTKFGNDISVKAVLTVELKEKVDLLKKAFEDIKDENLGNPEYNYRNQSRFDYISYPEGGRADGKLPYLSNINNNDVSKVVDENGEPLVVYHNTSNEFTKFSKFRAFVASLTGSNMFGRGFYFSNHQGNSLGNINMPVFLRVVNPSEGDMASKNDGMIHSFGNGEVWYATKNPNQIKSATYNNGDFSTENDDIQMMVIGEKGAKSLDMAEEANTRMDNLSVANDMEKVGKDALTIKAATGWERGADGKWRYEVSDIELNQSWFEKISKMETDKRKGLEFSLSDILSENEAVEILKQYPRIASLKITVYNDTFFDLFNATRGYYNSKTNTLMLNFRPVLFGKAVTAEEIKSTLAHELQHLIQSEEGFAPGGNENLFNDRPEIKELEKQEDDLKKLEDEMFVAENAMHKVLIETDRTMFDKTPEYKKWREEQDNLENINRERKAKNQEIRRKRQELLDRQEKEYREYQKSEPNRIFRSHAHKEWVTRGAQLLLQQIEEQQTFDEENKEMPFVLRTSFKGEHYNYAKYTTEERERISKEVRELKRKWEKESKAYNDLRKQQDDLRKKINSTKHSLYKRIAGEAESRTVQRRLGLSDKERRESLFTDEMYKDVAKEDLIFLQDGLNESASQPVSETPRENTDVIQQFSTPQGEVYGFVDKDGNIYLDEDVISPEHPIHEYTHLWDRAVAKRNPKFWKAGVNIFKKTSLWKEIEEDSNYGKKWKEQGISGERLDSLIASEVHSRLTGKRGLKVIEEITKKDGHKGIVAKLKKWLVDFWKELKSAFSNWSDAELKELEALAEQDIDKALQKLSDMTLADFVGRTNLTGQASSSESPIKVHQGDWSREEASKPENQDKLYIFTDNTDRSSGREYIRDDSKYAKRYGKGKRYPKTTSAVLRGLDNAMPISTQRWYHGDFKGEKGRWTNADVEEFKRIVHQEVNDIIEEWKTGNYRTIVLPKDGIFGNEESISDLNGEERSQIKKALEDEMKRLYAAVGVEYSDETAPLEKTAEELRQEKISSNKKELWKKKLATQKWARRVSSGKNIEVSSAGDEFGRQFSALNAVFPEGTQITIKIGGGKNAKEQTFDIGGYSIEAAYHKIKGYNNPKGKLLNSEGKLVTAIQGKRKSPKSGTILHRVLSHRTAESKKALEDFSYRNAYLPLWRMWADMNPDLIQQLKEKAEKENAVLTDKFADTMVSQARALADIIWGETVDNVSEATAKKYALEREQAIKASEEILQTVRELNSKEGIASNNNAADKVIADRIKGKVIVKDNGVQKKYIASYKLASEAWGSAANQLDNKNDLFANPFEGQPDALEKFIQWIIPNDFFSLPPELRVAREQRDAIRVPLSKGRYANHTIFFRQGDRENVRYAKTLRYIIDNFKELRMKYNPVDIQTFGHLHHKVMLRSVSDETSKATSVMRAAPEEMMKGDEFNDTNSVKIERFAGGENKADHFVITFPSDFNSTFSKAQQIRMLKTLAMTIPEGATVTIDATVFSRELMDVFSEMTKIDFTRVDSRQVTMSDGSLDYVGTYRRNEYQKPQVEEENALTIETINKDGRNKATTFYLVENIPSNKFSEKDPIVSINTQHNNKRTADSYIREDPNDSQKAEETFQWFKRQVDKAIARAKEAMDNGYTVVIPKAPFGSTGSALKSYAPRCYQYVNDRIVELKEYGNRSEIARQYFASPTTTVEVPSTNPGDSISTNNNMLNTPRATIHQRFSDDEIHDLSELYADVFIDALEDRRASLIRDIRKQLETEKDFKKVSYLQRKLNKLLDNTTGLLQTIKESNMEGEGGMLELLKEKLQPYYQNRVDLSNSGKQCLFDSLNTAGYFELIMHYAFPLIEDKTGIRISDKQEPSLTPSQAETNDGLEDTYGEDGPEMTWQYNYRLVDPYKALTASIRKLVNGIEMRDPNDLRKKVPNSIGRNKKYNSDYIYASIMSRMAQETLGNPDNFMRLIPNNELTDRREKRQYAFGKPVFPILEGMKQQYPWVVDLIKELEGSWKIGRILVKHGRSWDEREEVMKDPVLIAELGNTASQFWANFCQSNLQYATMVNGDIIEENRATGEQSLKQSAVNNYQGCVHFKGIDMVYNFDGSVNNENIQKQLENVKSVEDRVVFNDSTELRGKKKGAAPFWNEIKRLQEEYGDNFEDAWENMDKEQRQVMEDLSNALLASGIQFPAYNLFCMAADKKSKKGIMEVIAEYSMCLSSIVGLPQGEHMFESDLVTESKEYHSKGDIKQTAPRPHWNRFFSKFGDYVTERELVSSSRILGKSRYSYVYPSTMSMILNNLFNKDIETVREYIRQEFMPCEWFYDPVAGAENTADGFKNKILKDAWEGRTTQRRFRSDNSYEAGHDLICKKDGYDEKEYQDWEPSDIYQIMFRELRQPQNKNSACHIIPVLSDSQVCKAIQTPKMDINESREWMRNTVLQELRRMDLVEWRNIIFNMQDLEPLVENKVATSEQMTYWNTYKGFYEAYKERRIKEKKSLRLEKIENFDDNGSKFCFFPELNDVRYSWYEATKKNDTFIQQIIRALSEDPNSPATVSISLKDVLKRIEVMTAEDFENKAKTVGLATRKVGDYLGPNGESLFGEYFETPTKEEIINMLIERALTDVMNSRINNFFWLKEPTPTSLGVPNETVFNAMLKEDAELASRYNSLPQETETRALTTKEAQEVQDFWKYAYNKAAEFYWEHTATMSQFLQIMVTDLAYYKKPDTFGGSVDFGKRFKQVYGAGMKMNTNSKFGKKVEGNIILKDRVRRSTSLSVIEGVLQKAVDEGRILDVEAEAVLDKFKFIKGTDAQAYRSLTSWRDVMDMVGRSSEELFQAIDNLRKGTWTMKDFYTVFQTVKPFTYGPEMQDSGIDDIQMRTMVQHKNSEAVLLAIYNTLVGSAKEDDTYSARLKGLNKAMEEIYLEDENGQPLTYMNGERMRAIDVAQYQSAVKVGSQGLVDINYSRKKLEKAQKDGYIEVGGKHLKVGPNESYYSIMDRLENALDAKAISEEEYNRIADYLEPDADEIKDIIDEAIHVKDESGNVIGYNDQILHRIPYKYYSIQQPTPNHYTDNDSGTFGSQPRHIIMADLPEDFEITINGKKYNREQIRERYNGLLIANLLDCYTTMIEPMFNDVDKKKTPAQRLRDRLLPLIEGNPKYGNNLVNALQLDEHGNFAMPLNNLTVAHQLEEIITSMFKNAIHRQHINGGNAIIAADEGVGYSKKLKVHGERDAEGHLISVTGVECYLPAHSKKMLMPYLKKRVTTDEEGKLVESWELDPEKLKAAGLDKAVGYRIPTEGLYSIMPLIIRGFLPQQSGSSIVLAQEVVTLTGSDNDVDKLYLMLKNMGDDGKAIKTPMVEVKDKDGKTTEEPAHPMDMSKKERDNEIIDIFYGITTHPQMSHMFLSPGNFDTIRIESQKVKILKHYYLRKLFLRKLGWSEYEVEKLADFFCKSPNTDCTEEYRRVMDVPQEKNIGTKTMLDLIVDFTDKFQKPLPPVYPDTFVDMHQMYMAGVAEKGIFANNTLDHAKLQWANVRISPAATFIFEGQEVEKVDERYVARTKDGVTYRHYISKDCAEGGAASVDNGKEPRLNDANCNKRTATFYGFLFRLGLGIDGATALLAQPDVDYSIKTTGIIRPKILYNRIKEIEAWLKQKGFEVEDDRFNWRLHNFTVREWYINTMVGNRFLLDTDDTSDAHVERVASVYMTLNLLVHLLEMNNEMADPRTILHYDSPTNAADTEFGGVIAQTKAVQAVNERVNSSEPKLIYGEENLLVYQIEKKAAEQEKQKKEKEGDGKDTIKSFEELKKSTDPKRKLFDTFLSSEMPFTQAAYTLGIEKIRTELKEHFMFGREEFQTLVDHLWDYMDNIGIRSLDKRKRIVAQMFKDWTVYRLSKTKLFGNDDTMTYDQKRQYYLYQFPEEFMRLKEQVPELNQIAATRSMYVEKGIIMMHRGQKTTVNLRDFLIDSFDTLIQSKNDQVREVAKKLFMYQYYLNGFDFGYMSFGNMMSTEYQRAFPEYIEALREMNTEPITEEDMDNFFNQMLVKRNGSGLLPQISYSSPAKRAEGLQQGYHDTGLPLDYYGDELSIPEYVVSTAITKGSTFEKSEVLRLNRALSEMLNTIIYVPIRMNTPFHFNCNQTLEEMLDVVYNQDLINRNKRFGIKNKSGYSYYQGSGEYRVNNVSNLNKEIPAGNVQFDGLDNYDRMSLLDGRDIESGDSLRDENKIDSGEVDNVNINPVEDKDPMDKIKDFVLPEKYLHNLNDNDKTEGVNVNASDIKEGTDIVKNSNNGKEPC